MEGIYTLTEYSVNGIFCSCSGGSIATKLDAVLAEGGWSIEVKGLMAAVIRFERPENEQALLQLIDLVNEIS